MTKRLTSGMFLIEDSKHNLILNHRLCFFQHLISPGPDPLYSGFYHHIDLYPALLRIGAIGIKHADARDKGFKAARQ